MVTIYLAAPLFNAGERLHNLFLEKELKELGYKVVLPQRKALEFFNENQFDTDAIAEDCRRSCTNPEYIYVGCIDGTDAESGTTVEYTIAAILNGRAIIYRTDFRTAIDKELGVNAMFKLKGTTFIYHPCFFTELSEVDTYYKELALKIHKAIHKLGLVER